ncbi:MAG: ATP synthase F0 subunit B [Holophagales bacterium]|jgi:F-type H+-transporting ATPase subunit b|nr:ATP synthase F0 subunit B [Holophagales bacterium]
MMWEKYKHLLFMLTALACACHFSPSLAAQQHASASQTEISETIDQDTRNATHGAHSENSHEEAGHADGSGHHGDPVNLFGRQIGDTGQFFLKLINFLIFGGLLFWILKGSLASAFRTRANEIEMKLLKSERDRLEGEAQLRELETKMAGLEQELGGIMEKAKTDAEAEKQRILEAARAEADQILTQVQSEIEYQKRLAEAELRGLVAKLAVEGAESRIQRQVQGDSAIRIMDHAIQQIGGAK